MQARGCANTDFTLSLPHKLLNIMAMKELITKIQESYQAFVKDAHLQVENGNKAAGVRARKASLEIEKMMKEFRRVSLENAKK